MSLSESIIVRDCESCLNDNQNGISTDSAKFTKRGKAAGENGAIWSKCAFCTGVIGPDFGSGIPGESVLTTAQNLLVKFGSLEGVVNASLAELQSVRGLGGGAKASQLKACLEIGKRISVAELNRLMAKPQVLTAEDVAKIARGVIEDFSKEHLVVLCFDVRQRIVGQEVVSVGILDANLVHPREVFACALKYRAACIILAHNHPSGDATPSEEDRLVTRRLQEAAKVMGIALVDHVIVTKTSPCSVED